MNTELKGAFHNRLAEPIKPAVIIQDLMQNGYPEEDVRSTMFHLLNQKELNLSNEWFLQNGENHTRQLELPGMSVHETKVFEAKALASE